MDSWTEKQIAAMEQSGGNKSLVDFFSARGIEKSLSIATKYNTKQAAYYKERLSRRLEGKTEPPPDPGRYDPATGVSEAQGAEPLPGETTDEYNARQKRLREAAQERLRAKFGDRGMGGVGPSGSTGYGGGYGGGGGGGGVGSFDFDFDFDSLGGGVRSIAGAATGIVGGVASAAGSFVNDKVIQNENLHSSIRGTVGTVAGTATGAISSIRQSAQEGDTIGMLKRNVTLEEGTGLRQGLGWGISAVGGILGKVGEVAGGIVGGGEGGDSNQFVPQAPRCDQGHPLRTEPRIDGRCAGCSTRGTRYCCSQGCDYDICTKCFETPPAPDVPRPPTPTKDDMDRLARDMGMKLGSPPQSDVPARKQSSQSMPSSDAGAPMRAASAPVVANPHLLEGKSPEKKKEKAKLPSDDDFFGEFGL